jgi:hypothetical protein
MSNDKGEPTGWPRLKLMVLIKVTASKFMHPKEGWTMRKSFLYSNNFF